MEKFRVLVKALEDALRVQPSPERWDDIARWLSTTGHTVSVQEAKVSSSTYGSWLPCITLTSYLPPLH